MPQIHKIRLEEESQTTHKLLAEKEIDVQQIPQLKSQLQQITVSANIYIFCNK